MSQPIDIVITPSDAAAPASSTTQLPATADTTLNCSANELCLACKVNRMEYCSSTCRHRLYCKRCAMKCATGGKCKVCGELFPDLRRI